MVSSGENSVEKTKKASFVIKQKTLPDYAMIYNIKVPNSLSTKSVVNRNVSDAILATIIGAQSFKVAPPTVKNAIAAGNTAAKKAVAFNNFRGSILRYKKNLESLENNDIPL